MILNTLSFLQETLLLLLLLPKEYYMVPSLCVGLSEEYWREGNGGFPEKMVSMVE